MEAMQQEIRSIRHQNRKPATMPVPKLNGEAGELVRKELQEFADKQGKTVDQVLSSFAICPECGELFYKNHGNRKYCLHCARVIGIARSKEQRAISKDCSLSLRPKTIARREKMLGLREQGLGNKRIAEIVGCSSTYVRHCIGKVPPEIAWKNQGKRKPRLIESKGNLLIPDMQKLRDQGYTNLEIGRRVGLTYGSVTKYIGQQPAWITEASRKATGTKNRLNAERRRVALQMKANMPEEERALPYRPKTTAKLETARNLAAELTKALA